MKQMSPPVWEICDPRSICFNLDQSPDSQIDHSRYSIEAQNVRVFRLVPPVLDWSSFLPSIKWQCKEPLSLYFLYFSTSNINCILLIVP